MKYIFNVKIFTVLCLAGALFSAGCSSSGGSDATVDKTVISIGAILDVSGGYDSDPPDVKAVNLAVSDLNEQYVFEGKDVEIEVQIADCDEKPQLAMEQAVSLYEQGMRVIIGPRLSASAAYLLPWANENGVVLISHTSTAPYLAIADDNLYRLTPDDRYQAQTLSERMVRDGVEMLLPIYRNDVYGQQLAAYTSTAFSEQADGLQVLNPIIYDPYVSAEAEIVAELMQQLRDLDTSKVGVLLISSQEGTDVLYEIAKTEALPDLFWYGTDGLAHSDILAHDTLAAQFAVTQQMVFSHYYNANIESHEDYPALVAALGSPLDGKALNAYDAVRLAAMAYEQAGSSADCVALKAALEGMPGTVDGLSGTIQFNEAGDRVDDGHYVFCLLKEGENAGYVWSEE